MTIYAGDEFFDDEVTSGPWLMITLGDTADDDIPDDDDDEDDHVNPADEYPSADYCPECNNTGTIRGRTCPWCD